MNTSTATSNTSSAMVFDRGSHAPIDDSWRKNKEENPNTSIELPPGLPPKQAGKPRPSNTSNTSSCFHAMREKLNHLPDLHKGAEKSGSVGSAGSVGSEGEKPMKNQISRSTYSGNEPVHLLLVGNGRGEPSVGVAEVPGRLPTLWRFPGASPEAFTARALHLVHGAGPLHARLIYASDRTPPL